jgi:hypothetical protein
MTPRAWRRRITASSMLFAATGAVVAGALGAAAPANAGSDLYVAVAYSAESSKPGVAIHANENQARINALVNCQNSGGNHCVSFGTAKNTCIALAYSNEVQWKTATNQFIQLARRQAVQANSGGQVVAAGCATSPMASPVAQA